MLSNDVCAFDFLRRIFQQTVTSRRAGGQYALRAASHQEHLPKLPGGRGGPTLLLQNLYLTFSTCFLNQLLIHLIHLDLFLNLLNLLLNHLIQDRDVLLSCEVEALGENLVIWKQGDRTISAGSIMVGWLGLGPNLGGGYGSILPYLIFVTDTRTVSVEKKSVMWRIFKFLYMKLVKKAKISPQVD